MPFDQGRGRPDHPDGDEEPETGPGEEDLGAARGFSGPVPNDLGPVQSDLTDAGKRFLAQLYRDRYGLGSEATESLSDDEKQVLSREGLVARAEASLTLRGLDYVEARQLLNPEEIHRIQAGRRALLDAIQRLRSSGRVSSSEDLIAESGLSSELGRLLLDELVAREWTFVSASAEHKLTQRGRHVST